jgi:regulator of PEP synthase PpsR (kinase-PPPase family)
LANRTVFFVSDGTGITAETFGNSILAQFPIRPRHVRRPFIDSVEKALVVVGEINSIAQAEGRRPLVFVTLVNDEVRDVLTHERCQGFVLDMFRTFIEPLEGELAVKSNHRVGRFSEVAKSHEYNERIEAINFSLAHDDGQSSRDLEGAEVILVGVSRCGKTPTSLYLAMQHGVKAANCPLIPGGLRARRTAQEPGAAQAQVLRPDHRPRAAGANPPRAPPGWALCRARQLPHGSAGGRGDDEA